MAPKYFSEQKLYRQGTSKDVTKTHRVGKKLSDGIYMDYEQRAEGAWSGDLFIAYIGDLDNFPPSKIQMKRLRPTSKSTFPKKSSGTKQSVAQREDEQNKDEENEEVDKFEDSSTVKRDFIFRSHRPPRICLFLPEGKASQSG